MDYSKKNNIDNNELALVNQLIQALDIDIDERGLLSQSFMTLTVPDNRSFKRLAVPSKNVQLNDEYETYFQPLNNNKHNKVLLSIFLQQYPVISDINFEGTNIVFIDTNNKRVHVETDTLNPKEGVIHAILNYINAV